MTLEVARAYSATGAAWQAGPGLVYDHLADRALDRIQVDLDGRDVLDLGAGTGAASRAAQRRGARVVAVDVAFGMLAAGVAERPPAALGDAVALPFRAGAFDAVVAAFSLNHLDDPVAALCEAARVLRAGGGLLATAYAADDTHPVKEAVEGAARARGWRAEPWYEWVRTNAVPLLASEERAHAAARAAGLVDASVAKLAVPFPDLGPDELVAWRLGMAQLAPFVAALAPGDRAALAADARARLGDAPSPLVRSVIVLSWVKSS